MNRALVIGAGSTIAQAIVAGLATDDGIDEIVAVCRSPEAGGAETQLASGTDKVHWLQSDYSEQSIARVCRTLSEVEDYPGSFSRVVICNGILHTENLQPEKRLEDLTADSFQEVLQANAIVPLLWLKHLHPILAGDSDCTVAVFSARVGSIADNRRGGWYSYRASKAALNMLLRTAAIEYQRRAPNVSFLAFHPGTTNTPLSKPFQRNVPEDKLFTPEFVAGNLIELMAAPRRGSDIRFIDWAGKSVPW